MTFSKYTANTHQPQQQEEGERMGGQYARRNERASVMRGKLKCERGGEAYVKWGGLSINMLLSAATAPSHSEPTYSTPVYYHISQGFASMESSRGRENADVWHTKTQNIMSSADFMQHLLWSGSSQINWVGLSAAQRKSIFEIPLKASKCQQHYKTYNGLKVDTYNYRKPVSRWLTLSAVVSPICLWISGLPSVVSFTKTSVKTRT